MIIDDFQSQDIKSQVPQLPEVIRYCQIIFFKLYSLLSCCIRRGVSSCFAVGVLRSNEAEVKRRGCSSFNAGGGGGGGKGGGCLLCPTYLLISHRVHLIVNYVIRHFSKFFAIHGAGNFGSHTSADNLARR